MLGFVVSSSTQASFTKTFKEDSKKVKNIIIAPVAYYHDDLDRMWHFYGRVAKANSIVPASHNYNSGDTNIVALEIKTSGYTSKYLLSCLICIV